MKKVYGPAPASKRRANFSLILSSKLSSPEAGMTSKCPRVYIRTFGCQMNNRDSEVIEGLLARAGYELADDEKGADVIVFNTCSVRQHAEDKVWSEIGRIAKLSPPDLARKTRQIKTGGTPRPTKKIVGLVGCMAQNYKEGIFKRSPAVDFVVGPSDIAKVPEIISELLKKRGQSPKKGDSPLFLMKIWETDGNVRPEEIYHTGFYEDKNHAYVVISEGCSNYCSYCVVPYVRGELHNRDYKDILKEIEEAVGKGITGITLLGQNVNAYVSENREKIEFVKLLKLVDEIKGLKEFTFITSHPKDTSVELFKAMAQCEKLKKYLHLPVQSGSDKILKLMNRGYTKSQYLKLVDEYKKIIPAGMISTDVIVGFPAETEADFLETFDLMKKVKFDSAYLFKYSPRPGTQAEGQTDDVPEAEKKRRHKILLDYQKELHKKKG